MNPQFKALQTTMVRNVARRTPSRKRCPKCKRVRDVRKFFGFRTQHDAENGKPQRAMPQSYCKDCRA